MHRLWIDPELTRKLTEWAHLEGWCGKKRTHLLRWTGGPHVCPIKIPKYLKNAHFFPPTPPTPPVMASPSGRAPAPAGSSKSKRSRLRGGRRLQQEQAQPAAGQAQTLSSPRIAAVQSPAKLHRVAHRLWYVSFVLSTEAIDVGGLESSLWSLSSPLWPPLVVDHGVAVLPSPASPSPPTRSSWASHPPGPSSLLLSHRSAPVPRDYFRRRSSFMSAILQQPFASGAISQTFPMNPSL
jgi:hypothetical protein